MSFENYIIFWNESLRLDGKSTGKNDRAISNVQNGQSGIGESTNIMKLITF